MRLRRWLKAKSKGLDAKFAKFKSEFRGVRQELAWFRSYFPLMTMELS